MTRLDIVQQARRDRQERAREAMARHEHDFLLATPGSSLRWLTGLHVHRLPRLVAQVIGRDGDSFLLCPAFEADNMRRGGAMGTVTTWNEQDDPWRRLADEIRRRRNGTARIGLEPTTWFWMAERIRTGLPDAELIDAGPLFEALRSRKAPDEVEAIRRAGRLAEEAVAAARLHLTEGMTERDAARILVDELRAAGEFHEPMVQFGPSTAIPHATPGGRPLARGDMVLFDLSGVVDGYLSDITRMTCFGDATPEMKRIYDIVHEAQRTAIGRARSGVPCQEVDRAARQVITRAGYGEFFTHRTGHGIGLDIHEAPWLVEGNEARLEAGQVVTIEPGIYLPGRFGIRIEDDILITDTGADVLTDGEPRLLETP